jgi:poly(3-hydroxybutyrate) depolymerase
MTVEGENDDISGVGQTEGGARAVQFDIPTICAVGYLMSRRASAITASSTARASSSEIVPRISDFMLTLDMKAAKERRNDTAETARKALKVAG